MISIRKTHPSPFNVSCRTWDCQSFNCVEMIILLNVVGTFLLDGYQRNYYSKSKGRERKLMAYIHIDYQMLKVLFEKQIPVKVYHSWGLETWHISVNSMNIFKSLLKYIKLRIKIYATFRSTYTQQIYGLK